MSDYFINTAANLHPKIVEQYFAKRDLWNKQRNNAPDFHGDKDRFDDLNHIVIATDGDQCFGGVRLNGSRYSEPLLPMEQHGLRVSQMFPEFELERKTYVELSKFVVCEEGKALPPNNRVMYDIIHYCLYRMCETKDIDYMFAWSGKTHIRIYQIMGRIFQYQTVTKQVDVKFVPECCLALGEIHLFALDLKNPLKTVEQQQYSMLSHAGEPS